MEEIHPTPVSQQELRKRGAAQSPQTNKPAPPKRGRPSSTGAKASKVLPVSEGDDADTPVVIDDDEEDNGHRVPAQRERPRSRANGASASSQKGGNSQPAKTRVMPKNWGALRK